MIVKTFSIATLLRRNGKRKLVLALLSAALLMAADSASVYAQSVSNLYMAGVSYSPAGSPTVAGSALYAHQINSSGTYAFTMLDALPSTSAPFTVSTNVGVGVAQKVATIDGVDVFVPSSLGISYTGTNTGWQWSTGAGAIFKVKPDSNWYVMPNLRFLKSSVSTGGYQPIFGVMFGWGQ